MVSKEILGQPGTVMKHPVVQCGRGGVDPYRAHNPETQFESDVRHKAQARSLSWERACLLNRLTRWDTHPRLERAPGRW